MRHAVEWLTLYIVALVRGWLRCICTQFEHRLPDTASLLQQALIHTSMLTMLSWPVESAVRGPADGGIKHPTSWLVWVWGSSPNAKAHSGQHRTGARRRGDQTEAAENHGEGGTACPGQGRGPQGRVTQFVLHPLLVGLDSTRQVYLTISPLASGQEPGVAPCRTHWRPNFLSMRPA